MICEYENKSNVDKKNKGYRSVFDALYIESRILKEKKQNLVELKTQQDTMTSLQYKESKKWGKSEKILLKMQRNILKTLFDHLDHDYDGYISAHKIDISNISNELLDVLTPLLLKIEEHSLQLDFEQFWEIVLEFSKSLPLTDKEILLGAERNYLKSPPQQFSFQPELTANTRALAHQNPSEGRKANLWEDHRVRTNGDKENEDMSECTFHPQTHDYNPKKFKKGISSNMGLKDTLVQTMGNTS